MERAGEGSAGARCKSRSVGRLLIQGGIRTALAHAASSKVGRPSHSDMYGVDILMVPACTREHFVVFLV